jgi:hypothetical protein
MEFQIKNPFIKRFLSKYSNQNELKLLKYLTILGIKSLESLNRESISFSDIKRLASIPPLPAPYFLEEVSKSIPKENKKIDQELKHIKSELARLNERFESKLTYLTL